MVSRLQECALHLLIYTLWFCAYPSEVEPEFIVDAGHQLKHKYRRSLTLVIKSLVCDFTCSVDNSFNK